jgi:isocitrate dehydrogenase
MGSQELKNGMKRKRVTLTVINKLKVMKEIENCVKSFFYPVAQHFSNFFQVGTTFIVGMFYGPPYSCPL